MVRRCRATFLGMFTLPVVAGKPARRYGLVVAILRQSTVSFIRILFCNHSHSLLLCGLRSYVAQIYHAVLNTVFLHFLRHITNGSTFRNLAGWQGNKVQLTKKCGWDAASTAEGILSVMWRLDGLQPNSERLIKAGHHITLFAT
jgi:hypothetical protein